MNSENAPLWRVIWAWSHLGWALLLRGGRRLFRGVADNGGERRFLENFAGEGLAPFSVAEAGWVRGLTRCVGCGLCEAVCPIGDAAGPTVTPDRWPAYARATALATQAARAIPAPCPESCGACADVCPTAVPLRETPAFLARRASQAPMPASRGGPASG